MSEPERLLALLEPFHITDRALVRTRDRARATGDSDAAAALKREMRKYFTAVERESAAQMSSIDNKLDELYQRQYNLQAERGIAERRLLQARKVLTAIELAAEEKVP